MRSKVACAGLVVLVALGALALARGSPVVNTSVRAPLDAAAAEEVAAAWFEALIGGRVEVVRNLSDVPFAWDGKQVLGSLEELTAMCRGVVADKGARAVPGFSAECLESVDRIEGDCVPVSYRRVRLAIGDEAMLICVRPGDGYRVVGFRD